MLSGKRPIENDVDPMRKRMKGVLTLQEDVKEPGHVLQYRLTWLTTTTVTPEIVRTIIRRALLGGWDPASRRIPGFNLNRVVVELIQPQSWELV
jgi:hypothetical protein